MKILPIERISGPGAEPASTQKTQLSAVPGTAPFSEPAASPAVHGRTLDRRTLPAPAAARSADGAWLRARLRQAGRNWPQLAMALVSLSLFVAAWHFATEYKIDWYVRFGNIPSPMQVLSEGWLLAQTEAFYTNMWVSLRRVLLGFGVATVLGVLLGLLIGRFAPVRGLLLPTLEALRPIPAIAWVPMSIMLWPSNEESIVFITFLGSFFPILLNTIHGVNAVDPVLLRAARSLGASEARVLHLVILKSALPHVFTGLSVGMGVAWVSLIAAEMISGQFGIGYFTWEAYSLIEYSHIVLGMVLIGLLGLLCSGAIHLVGNALTPWARLQPGGRT